MVTTCGPGSFTWYEPPWPIAVEMRWPALSYSVSAGYPSSEHDVAEMPGEEPHVLATVSPIYGVGHGRAGDASAGERRPRRPSGDRHERRATPPRALLLRALG